jgi:hypothetical protein
VSCSTLYQRDRIDSPLHAAVSIYLSLFPVKINFFKLIFILFCCVFVTFCCSWNRGLHLFSRLLVSQLHSLWYWSVLVCCNVFSVGFCGLSLAGCWFSVCGGALICIADIHPLSFWSLDGVWTDLIHDSGESTCERVSSVF